MAMADLGEGAIVIDKCATSMRDCAEALAATVTVGRLIAEVRSANPSQGMTAALTSMDATLNTIAVCTRNIANQLNAVANAARTAAGA